MIYIYSYFREYDENASLSTLSWVFPGFYLISQITMTFIEDLLVRFSVIKLCFFSLLLLISPLIITSFIQKTAIFMVFYVVFTGISLGILYMLPIICGLRYFPDKKARVIGLIHFGDVFGCFLYAFLINNFLNINDLKPDFISEKSIYFNECVAGQIPRFLKILAASYLILGFVTLSYIQKPREKTEEFIVNSMKKTKKNPLEMSLKKKLGIVVLFTIMSIEGLFFLMFYKQIGFNRGINGFNLLWIGAASISMIWLARIPWNFIKNPKTTIISVISMQFFAKIVIFKENWYFITIFSEFISLGGLFSVAPRVFIKEFTEKMAKKLNKLQMISFGLSPFFIMFFKELLIKIDDNFLWGLIAKDVFCLGLAMVLWSKNEGNNEVFGLKREGEHYEMIRNERNENKNEDEGF